jgi:hypothetical protein
MSVQEENEGFELIISVSLRYGPNRLNYDYDFSFQGLFLSLFSPLNYNSILTPYGLRY